MTQDSRPSPPSAVAAFLRGVDRRARLLAQIQTGDARAGQTAVIAASRVFATEASQWPMPEWPRVFWRLLLSTPAMGHTVRRPAAGLLPGIARLPPAQRAAVLLHLVAGLDDTDGAAVLDLALTDYHARIRAALPQDPHGQPDLDVWRAWHAAVKRALDTLPDPAPAPPAVIPADATAARQRRLRWLWLGVLLCALALAATFLAPIGRTALDGWRQRIHGQPLPPPAPPRAWFDPDTPAGHPDLPLLAAPGELALARRLPVLAWLDAEALPAAPGQTATLPAAPPEPIHSPRLRQRMHAWDRLAPVERARARGAWAEWQALTDDERARLRAAAARFDALSDSEQQALLSRYAALPFDAHRGWHLGPRLGRDWPQIAPLLAYVRADERPALLQMLRNADAEQRALLARLAQSTPPQARARLRDALRALPPERRNAWLTAQLNG
ncbi:DUF3106 domain-containing protein [Thermomonas hydrothermalis]|nr:DUF3106 domain-containing protein [Thermomonas hydrothermalis]